MNKLNLQIEQIEFVNDKFAKKKSLCYNAKNRKGAASV